MRIILYAIFSIAIGFLFIIPHCVRIVRIGSFHDYSPYTASSPSATVADETYVYISEVNYMLQHKQLAYDTDAYEHRNDPFPYSVLPAVIEAGFAAVTGDLRIAQIICHFVFPAIAALLMITLFGYLGASVTEAALMSLSVLVFGFSLQTLFNGISSFILFGLHSGFIETLQAARNPHPNMSFPHFLGAVICMITSVVSRSRNKGLVAGVIGGALFYSYSFYAIAWTIGCILLLLWSVMRAPKVQKIALYILAANTVIAAPYFLWMRESRSSGSFTNRAVHFGLTQSHLPSRRGAEISLLYLAIVVLLWMAWTKLSKHVRGLDSHSGISANISITFVVLTCMTLGGICGLNMQLITGFNIEPEHHYPHMVLQPCILLFVACLLLFFKRQRGTTARTLFRVTPAIFAVLYAACCISQVNSGYNSAVFHKIRSSDRQLFDWLRQNSAENDVVATTDMRLNISIPDYTHNSLLVVNGIRSSAPDHEIVERFLLANALAGVSASSVTAELAEEYSDHSRDPRPVLWTYSFYLFEHSQYFDNSHGNIRREFLPAMLGEYQDIRAHLPEELEKYRVNFLYTVGEQAPPAIPGWQIRRVLETNGGILWGLQRAGQ